MCRSASSCRVLREHPDIKYVIIYMRSRAFRNYVDAGVTERQLSQQGIKLISAKEDFGDGIWGDAMKAVADIMNEVQVRMSGEDIRTKLRNKAISGGTISRAKIGYLNTRLDVGGKLVNTIAVDQERAPLVVKAFELYATGDYTIERLETAMGDLGLTTRPSGRWTARPVSANKLHVMLRDPYYIGYVEYQGERYPGRHEPIIERHLFERVQEILDFRSRRGQRDRVLQHYLKGMLHCDRCHQKGRTARLIYTEAKSRSGGRYAYFLCRIRQERCCDLPHLPAWQVEEAIERHYTTLQLDEATRTAIDEELGQIITEEQQLTHELHGTLTKQLAQLDDREERLLDLAADGNLPQAKIRARLHGLDLERQRLRDGLTHTGKQLAEGVEILRLGLRLIADPGQLYSHAPDGVRRQLNQAFYQAIYIDDHGQVRTEPNPPFDGIHEAAKIMAQPRPGLPAPTTKKHPELVGVLVDHYVTGVPARDLPVAGSSKTVLVGRAGLEPATEGL